VQIVHLTKKGSALCQCCGMLVRPLLREHDTVVSQDVNQPLFTQKATSQVMVQESNLGCCSISLKLVLLILLVFQCATTVLIGRYTRSSVPESDLYEVTHHILVCEIAKFLLSLLLEFYYTGGELRQSLEIHIVQNPQDALKISPLALLYLLQNTLFYIALKNLSAPVFLVTNQAKLVTTAIVSVIVLGRSYSVCQWICLMLLSAGVAIIVLGEQAQSTSVKGENNQNLFIGLSAVCFSCYSSAFAGVYFEKILKNESTKQCTNEPSLWMRNIQLSFFSIVVASFQMGFNDNGKPFFHGFSILAWVLVAMQAGGGLLVAAVIKHADNVLKGLATGVSVVLVSFISALLAKTNNLTEQFIVGAFLILCSVYLFSNPIPSCSGAFVYDISSMLRERKMSWQGNQDEKELEVLL
jgi:UDP-sugar transporter A1/2/3